jgi:DNA-directed RNA polymerase beta subunit/DNA-directed RNA polymerase beta' subunit
MKYNAIKTQVADAIRKNLHGYTIDDKTINVKSIKFDERNIHKQISWNHIQKVKNKNGTVSVPIIANIEIKKGNRVLSRDKNLNIGQLPIVTKNGTALVDGIEYTVPVQIRRDPGIYTSQSTNGTWKTMINSAKGKNFKVEMDPMTNIQKIEIDGTRIPLLPILHHFGIKKDQIIKAWGGDKNAKDLYTLNERAGFTATGRKSLGTLYKKLIYGAHPSATDVQMKAALQTYMKDNSEFQPDVNKKTLGNPHKTLSPVAFLDISKKLINSAKVGMGDDTENLIFKHIKTADDMIVERLNLDFRKKLTASLSRNLKNNTRVKDIVRPGFFTQSLKGFYKNSEISEPSEQINPLHMINTATKTTIKGEGGITDENTVNLDMKSLHPSYLGYLDPIHTPDGSAGLVNHLTMRTIKDDYGKFMNMFYNKKGKIQYASVNQTWDAKVATPDQYVIKKNKKPIPKSTRIKVMQAGETKIVNPSAVDYIIAQSSQMFDPATNLVPFINSDSGNRVSMGAKFGEQSISLVNRETPHVSTVDEHGKEFIEDIGSQFAIKSPMKGIVKKIGKDFIELKVGSKTEKVDLRNHMEMNQESYFHDEPIVKVGQKVNKGTILASNNWTDKKGNFLNGTNTRITFLPYKGYSIEDGIVVSDSYAQKMSSQHMHVEEINIKEGGLNLDKFKLNFKNKYPFESFQKLDERGIVKKGSDVQKGDILIAYSKPIEFSEIDKIVGRLSKGFKSKSLDNSAVWNYDFPGHVVDVIKSGNLVKVKVKSIQPLQVTDKLALAHGNKGVVSAVVPDSQMPQTSDGKPIEAIFNPNGTTARINFGQAFEASLGKITEKTGKRYLIKNFEHPNNWEFVKGELRKHKISDTEVLTDPETGKELKSWNPSKKQFDHPFVGNAYVRKLVHQTRKKFDARGRGAYSAIDMPGKDPESSHYIGDSASKENPKSIDRLTTYSVLAHGGKDVIADMWNNKGQNRADVWESIISGAPIPPPRKSMATTKMEALMRAAGVNTERKGRFITPPPLTDRDTKEISSGKIEKPNLFLRGKDLIPIKGGMFDPILTGGMKNFDRYNHMDLGVKIPNPITKNAIKSLLDLSDSDFDNILKGDKVIGGKTGSEYMDIKLKEIDVNKTIKKLETDKITAPKTKINTINRKLRYLRALRGSGIEPHEYMISKIPIIPTGFRPIITLPNGTIEPAPINQLYRDVAIASKLATDKTFPKKLRNEATHELYNTLSGLQGVTDPTINKQTTTRKLKSVLTELAGSGSPKGGFIHSKLLSKTQDYIGSSVIGVNPHLGIDEVGLPYEMAEKIYEPFLLKELRASGHKISDFSKLKKENPQVIKNILEKIVKERPVVINRNPSLHKGSVWGQNPVLITGKSIQVNPMILKPLNADFDGDTIIISAPISKKAVEQVKTMIPSLNILNPKNDEMNIAYDQEYMAGIALMTENGRKLNLSFKNLKEMEDAYAKNKIRVNDIVKIGGKITSYGRLLMMKALPPELGYKGQSRITKKEMNEFLKKMVKDGSVSKYTNVINNIKDLGAKYAYDEGFSFSLDDIRPRKDIRSKYLNPSIPSIVSNKSFNIGKAISTTQTAQSHLTKDLISEHNRAFLPSVYGSRNVRPDVMQQIVATPFFVSGLKGPISTPISKSYSEGLDLLDNFNVSYGSRKAIVDKVNQVSEPGALSKELVATMSGEVITRKDCGTHDGVHIKLDDTFNLQNRVLAEPVNGLSRNTILDKKHLQELRKGRTKNILIRSPLTCKAPKGVCSMCYGYNEHHQLPNLGDPIGLKAAQSIGETGTQSALSSHHLGGTVAAGSFRTGFDHTKFLLQMPQNVKAKATLAGENGIITSIKEGINKSNLVFIGKTSDPYICFNPLKVKVGSKVHAGDPLDQGPIKIQELVELAPMHKVQTHLVEQLEKSFSGTKILRRNTETIVRGVTQYSKVIKPGESPYLENELVPSNMVEWIKLGKKINVDDVIGWKLKAQTGKYTAGTQITVDIANDLLKKGKREVTVNANGLQIKNQTTNISSIPLIQPDFYKKLSFERIRNSMKEGPISGAYSNVHGSYPEPSLITGVDIGLEHEE